MLAGLKRELSADLRRSTIYLRATNLRYRCLVADLRKDGLWQKYFPSLE